MRQHHVWPAGVISRFVATVVCPRGEEVDVVRRTITAVSLAARCVVIIALSVPVVSAAYAAGTRVDIAAPGNDARDAASAITDVPGSVRGTLNGTSVEGAAAGGPDGQASISVCEGSIVGDVWYRLASPEGHRLVVQLAGGAARSGRGHRGFRWSVAPQSSPGLTERPAWRAARARSRSHVTSTSSESWTLSAVARWTAS